MIPDHSMLDMAVLLFAAWLLLSPARFAVPFVGAIVAGPALTVVTISAVALTMAAFAAVTIQQSLKASGWRLLVMSTSPVAVTS